MIQIKGVLDGLTQATANGWVHVTGDSNNDDVKPLVMILLKGELIAKGLANRKRSDIEKFGNLAFGFSLTLKKEIRSINDPSDIKIAVTYKGLEANLKLHKPIELVLQFKALNNDQQLNLAGRIQNSINNLRIQPPNVLAAKNRSRPPVHKLCIITYANDDDAWFPYFYKYYSELVGKAGIYLVTPKPEAFNDYNLGGTISCKNMLFDNEARAQLMSGLVAGLQAYYKWTLICDVDEIISPHPNSGLTFFETLDLQHNDVILSRGFDVIQMENESDFSFDLPILKQRRYANPNMALSKPHLAKVPIQYGSGHHYCNYKIPYPEQNSGFITLHLKWACRKIRSELATIVAETVYADEKTAEYSKKSLSGQAFQARVRAYLRNKIETLNSPAMQNFEQKYAENLVFSANRGLWIGEHITAPFLVNLTQNSLFL